jgi:carbamoyl-phosphate synthase small subunit
MQEVWMSMIVPATLVLEQGQIFYGQSFGAEKDAVFELVFNTSMTGYQEILTDPSYRGQGVLFTVSHIGNVGINLDDYESASPQAEAVIVRALSPGYSNWRANQDLSSWMKGHGIPGIEGIDTRAIVRTLREGGTVKAGLSTRGTDPDTLLESVHQWPGLDGRDMVKEVSCEKPYQWRNDFTGDQELFRNQFPGSLVSRSQQSPVTRKKVILYDYGAKRNILRCLSSLGMDVMVVPANMPAEETLSYNPDGIMLSNGPGDPEGVPYGVEIVRKLINSGVPIFGICFGHQLIGLALGGKTSRLKFGHHGGNHPVQDVRSNKVFITAQNHNYTVLPESLNPAEVEVTHVSLNDNSLEGLQMKNKPVYSVQFHPESAPGPHDAHELFLPFLESIHSKR